MARAVSRRPLLAEAPMRSQVSPRRICAGQSGNVTVLFSPSTSVFPVSIIPPTLHIHLHPHVALTRQKTGKGWEPCIQQCYFGTRGALDIKQCHSFSPLKGSSQLTVSRNWRRGGTEIAQTAVRHVQRIFHHLLSTDLLTKHRFTATQLGKGTSRTRCIFFLACVVKSYS